MTLIAVVPQRELKYQAGLAFEGQSFKVFAALNPGALTAESDAADWLAEEISGGGYAPETGTVAVGAWNGTTGRYEVPDLTLALAATGVGFSYDAIITTVGTRTHCANVLLLPAVVTLAAGESKTYDVMLGQDD